MNATFYKAFKAYCLLKQNKIADCVELCQEVKSNRTADLITAKYMILIYNELGMYHETTNLLEYTLSMNIENEELAEELFFSYVRENKLLK